MRLIFDFESKTPIYQQLRDQIVVGIAEGRLTPGLRPVLWERKSLKN